MGETHGTGAPRIPALGIYPTVESLALQAVLLVLLAIALLWTFVLEPRKLKVTSTMVPEPASEGPSPMERAAVQRNESGQPIDIEMLRSLERMDADLAELRAEVERLKHRLLSPKSSRGPRV